MVQFYIIKNADMKTLTKIIPLAVSLFFIILFIYAGASKMFDFENFQVQLAQSPLLSAYAGFISYSVIILELVIAGMLCFKLTRLLGLYGSFFHHGGFYGLHFSDPELQRFCALFLWWDPRKNGLDGTSDL